ncbi:synaptopodin-2 [Synchiropus picturatus]
MEKFVVAGDEGHTKPRSPSPTSSLPHSWRYSSNVRAPPPLSYNPLLSPFYPPSAAKQASSSSPKSKPKEKPPKQLNALDIMKHQPYQLDSALFKYDVMTKGANPTPKPPPKSKFEVTKSIKQRFTDSPNTGSENKPKKSAKSSKCSQASPGDQATGVDEPLVNGKHLDEASTPSSPPTQGPGVRPASTSSQHSSVDDSIALAFSPAALIARGARQMAPRPKFSAKKPIANTKQWRPVAVVN